MAKFVLVHGSWQGAWVWGEIVPGLRASGHQAVAIDLPGHGADLTPVESITLQDYVDRVVEAVETSPQAAILVGHSMGGLVSQVAEAIPDRLSGLIYIAALVPPDGASMMQFVHQFDAEYIAQFLWAADGRTARISPEGARRFLYTYCPTAFVDAVLPLFTAEPVAPFEALLHLTASNFGRVRRYYIECLRDQVVPIALQRAMRLATSFDEVYSLDTDHSPFFSTPDALTAILHTIASRTDAA
jgi:pimeloyl-ACP methyl ester carboxylesterase